MAATVIPSLTGFIDKTKEQQYVIEAQEVRRSAELYLIDHYGQKIDSMSLMLKLTSCDLNSPEHPLAGYMTVTCSKGASVKSLTLDSSSLRITEFTYLAGGYQIVIDGEAVNRGR